MVNHLLCFHRNPGHCSSMCRVLPQSAIIGFAHAFRAPEGSKLYPVRSRQGLTYRGGFGELGKVDALGSSTLRWTISTDEFFDVLTDQVCLDVDRVADIALSEICHLKRMGNYPDAEGAFGYTGHSKAYAVNRN